MYLGEKGRSEAIRFWLTLAVAPTGTPQVGVDKQGVEVLAATNMTQGADSLEWYYDHTVGGAATVGAYQVGYTAVVDSVTRYAYDNYDVNTGSTAGAYSIIINIKDGSANPVEGVSVNIHNSANDDLPHFENLITDELGNTDTVNLNTATYTARLSGGGIVSENESVVVSVSATKNLTVALSAITEPGDPDLCRLYFFPITLGNEDVTDLTVEITSGDALTKINGEFIKHIVGNFTYNNATSPDSYYFDAVQGAEVSIKCAAVGFLDEDITVPATASADLDTLIS